MYNARATLAINSDNNRRHPYHLSRVKYRKYRAIFIKENTQRDAIRLQTRLSLSLSLFDERARIPKFVSRSNHVRFPRVRFSRVIPPVVPSRSVPTSQRSGTRFNNRAVVLRRTTFLRVVRIFREVPSFLSPSRVPPRFARKFAHPWNAGEIGAPR